MPLPRLVVLVLVVAGATGVSAPPALAGITTTQTLFLDSYSATDDRAKTVSTTDVLNDGTYYTVTIAGTYSGYSRNVWNEGPACGSPRPAPVDPSPGQVSTPAGADAEFVFGLPQLGGCPPLPAHNNSFLIDDGDGFTDLDPVNGSRSMPREDHTYTYSLRGKGKPVRFRVHDKRTTDNNGILSIRVRPAVRSECGNAECEAAAPDAPAPVEERPQLPEAEPGLIRAPSSRACLSRRRFRIHILRPRLNPYVEVAVTVAGRGVPVRKDRSRKGRRYFSALVDLRGKPKGRHEVRIVTRARDGELRKTVRRFRTCG